MAQETSTIGNVELPKREQIEAGLRQARSSLEELDRQARDLARERPFLAIIMAVAVGYAAGRVLSRL